MIMCMYVYFLSWAVSSTRRPISSLLTLYVTNIFVVLPTCTADGYWYPGPVRVRVRVRFRVRVMVRG